VDFEALAAHGRWLAGTEGITGLVCNGHAGEGLALTEAERVEVIGSLVDAVAGTAPGISGIASEGTRVAAREARRAADAGAQGLLVYPVHGWLRFGYQRGAPQDRYKAIAEASGLPVVLFLYPDVTRATHDLHTVVDLLTIPGVTAIKNGVRNMSGWDAEIPVIRREFPEVTILTCMDEFLLHSMWESDGALIGYAALVLELMVKLFHAARAHDYEAAKAVYDRVVPPTKAVYHLEPQSATTVALKVGLHYRGMIPKPSVRSPLLPLQSEQIANIEAALKEAEIDHG
jgi:4-hydroxy-tetrahydrodipicolinate synthase